MKSVFLALLTALLAGPFLATADEPAPLNATLTLGYDSRYVLYGYRLSRHLYHADVYLDRPVTEDTTLWGGGWYGYLTDGTYHEADLYGGVNHALHPNLTVGLAYSLFNYLEVPFPTSDQSHEIAAHATAHKDGFSLALRNQYDTEADGHLVRLIGGYSRPLTERVGVALTAEAGYSLAYFIPGNQWNHSLVKCSAPVTLTDTLSMSFFVARTIPLEAIRDFESYDTIGGLSFSLAL